MTKPSEDLPVCVTGVTGYIASFIVRELLAQNYRVRGTVRDLSSSSKVDPIRALDPTGEKLELVQLDLNDDASSTQAALSGCKALIHTAAPISHSTGGWSSFTTEEQALDEQVRPVVEGTETILRAAVNVGIKRVVLTSSNAAMFCAAEPHPVLDESCWSDENFMRKNILDNVLGAYPLAKTLQERLAWKLSEELAFHLVCLNPTFVLGPSITPHVNTGQLILKDLLRGEPNPYGPCTPGTIPDMYFELVDVREVANAHVLALKEGEGRMLLTTADMHYEDVWKVLREVDQRFRVKDLQVDSDDGRKATRNRFDNSKAVSMGLCKIPWEETIREVGHSIIQYGHWS